MQLRPVISCLTALFAFCIKGHHSATRHPYVDLIGGNRHVAAGFADESNSLLDKYTEFQTLLDTDLIIDSFQDVSPNWTRIFTNVSQDCQDAVGYIVTGVRQKQMWAMQFIDAAGKPETGIMQGNFGWLGSFGECRAINAVVNKTTTSNVTGEVVITESQFKGKYCLAAMGPPMNGSAPQLPEAASMGDMLSLRIGLCFPDRCSDQDTYYLVNNLLGELPPQLNISNSLEFYGTNCQPESYAYGTSEIILLSVLGVYGMLLVIATLYDIVIYQPIVIKVAQIKKAQKDSEGHSKQVAQTQSYPPIGVDGHHPQSNEPDLLVDASNHEAAARGKDDDDAPLLHEKPPVASVKNSVNADIVVVEEEIGALSQLLVVFSLYSNGKKLLSTSNGSDSITCVHGIRFLSITWVLLGHIYGFGLSGIRNIVAIKDVLGNFWFQAIANATVSVDTFFVMSGLLLSYLFVLGYQKKPRFPVVQFYVHRYWRLTAVYGVIMAVYLIMFAHFNIGPQWKPTGMEVDGCRDTWYINLLYMNNFIRTDKQCMGWTWYLANDMQFYWISPLIIFPLVKWPMVGLISLAMFFVAHIVTTAVLCVHYQFQPSMLGNGFNQQNSDPGPSMDYFMQYYIKPYTRIGPYLIGLLFGYILAVYRKERAIKLNKFYVVLCWTAATVVALSVLYGLWKVNNGTLTLDMTAATFYNVLHRNAWALSVCWVIFACVQGYGGFVNTILSWKFWVPLSRLTYCIYLIHIPIALAYYGGQTNTSDFSHFTSVMYFFGVLAISVGFAFLFSVAAEAPLLSLEKFVTKQLSKKKD